MTSGVYGYYDTQKKYVCYIGKDSNINDSNNNRHKAHYKPSSYNNQQINRVLQNNPNRYDYFILAEGNFSDDELNNMEKQAIEIFKTYYYDYPERSVFNYTKGGDGASGYKHTQEWKEKMSEKMSGENAPFYGRKHSEEAKKKMSKNHTYFSGENHHNYNKKFPQISKRMLGSNNPNFGTGDSGISHVHKSKSNRYAQGYIWVYKKIINGVQYRKSSVNLRKLEEKVINDNYPWEILDEEKAKQSYQESDKNNNKVIIMEDKELEKCLDILQEQNNKLFKDLGAAEEVIDLQISINKLRSKYNISDKTKSTKSNPGFVQ